MKKKTIYILLLICSFFLFSTVSKAAEKNAFCKYILPIDREQDSKNAEYSAYVYISKSVDKVDMITLEMRYNGSESNSSVVSKIYHLGPQVKGQNSKSAIVGYTNLCETAKNKGVSQCYTTEQLLDLFRSRSCPKSLWMGPHTGANSSKLDMGFVFSVEPIKLPAIGNFYNTFYDRLDNLNTGKKIDEEYKQWLEEYNELYNKLNSLILDEERGAPYPIAPDCSAISERAISSDMMRLQTLVENLKSAAKNNMSFNFSDGPYYELDRKITLARANCNLPDYEEWYDEWYAKNFGNGNIDRGTDLDTCQIIPDDIKKWIVNILKIVRYLALALVIVLGSLDFMRAAGSGEPDQMKKAGQTFIKRLIAVIVLFLMPYLVELLLGLINLLGADPNCVDIGSY